jgi:hypothetical protein
MTPRITLAAHLCGVGMGVATIVSLVPAVVRLLRLLV